MKAKEDTIIDIKQKISWSCWLASKAFLYLLYPHLTSQLQAHFCVLTGVFIVRDKASMFIISIVASASLPLQHWQVFCLSCPVVQPWYEVFHYILFRPLWPSSLGGFLFPCASFLICLQINFIFHSLDVLHLSHILLSPMRFPFCCISSVI